MNIKTVYKGICPRCAKVYIIKIDFKGLIPPPAINVSCQCNIPVACFTLIYIR